MTVKFIHFTVFCFGVLFFVIFSTASAQTSQLIISEIMADPKSVKDADGEWFELYNPTESELNLKGATVKDTGRDSFMVESDVVIGPKQYIVLCRNQDATTNGGVSCSYQYRDFSLANEEDEIIIEKDGQTIASCSYSKAFPLKTGKSMERAVDKNGELPEHWHEASVQFGDGDYGTPGTENSGAPLPTSTKTPSPKPTEKPTKTPVPSKTEKSSPTHIPTQVKEEYTFQPQVLGEAEEVEPDIEVETTIEVIEEASLIDVTEPMPEPVTESTPPPTHNQLYMGGSIVTMIGAAGSFWWIRKKGDL